MRFAIPLPLKMLTEVRALSYAIWLLGASLAVMGGVACTGPATDESGITNGADQELGTNGVDQELDSAPGMVVDSYDVEGWLLPEGWQLLSINDHLILPLPSSWPVERSELLCRVFSADGPASCESEPGGEWIEVKVVEEIDPCRNIDASCLVVTMNGVGRDAVRIVSNIEDDGFALRDHHRLFPEKQIEFRPWEGRNTSTIGGSIALEGSIENNYYAAVRLCEAGSSKGLCKVDRSESSMCGLESARISCKVGDRKVQIIKGLLRVDEIEKAVAVVPSGG